MSFPRVPIAGLLVATAILAIVFSMLSQPGQVVSNLWNLAVWTTPPTAIFYTYGSERCRSAIRTVAAALLWLVSGLLILAGFAFCFAWLLLRCLEAPELISELVTFDIPLALAFGSTVVAMALVTARCLRGRGLRRSFGLGFAAFGWPFLLIGLAPAFVERAPVLWTTELLHAVYPALYLTSFPDAAPPLPTLGGRLETFPRQPRKSFVFETVTPGYLRFQVIGHCLIGLALATAGGFLARTLAARRDAPAARDDETDPVTRSSAEASPLATLLMTSTRAIPGRDS
jgi:hypothetical protein